MDSTTDSVLASAVVMIDYKELENDLNSTVAYLKHFHDKWQPIFDQAEGADVQLIERLQEQFFQKLDQIKNERIDNGTGDVVDASH